MQLTTHTDYALRLLIYLAVRDESMPATVRSAAAHYGISDHHLAKVAQTLVKLGYLVGHRGRAGGLELARAEEAINVGRLVREVENLHLLECFEPNSSCPITPVCRLRTLLGEAQRAFLDVLDGHTLTTLIANDEQLRAHLRTS